MTPGIQDGGPEPLATSAPPWTPSWTPRVLKGEGSHDAAADAVPDMALLAQGGFEALPPGTFIGPVPQRSRPTPHPPFGHRGTRLLVPLRHFASDEAVAVALRAFDTGPVRVLMERWRGLWRGLAHSTGGDVGLLASKLGLGDRDHEASPMLGAVVEAARGRIGQGLHAAVLEELRTRSSRAFQRDEALHVLEDAALAVGLEDAGAKWGLVETGKIRPLLFLPWAAPRRRVSRAAARDGLALSSRALHSPPYWRTSAFQANAPRWMREAEDPVHAAAILLDMARQGRRKAFLKSCRMKGGTWIADLSGIATFEDALGRLASTMGAAAWRQGQGNGFVLVQDFVPFRREHRFFVAGGAVVASTSSDRFLSILDHHGGPGRLDPRVAELIEPPRLPGAYDRGMTRSATDRGGVAAMARLVRRLARDVEADPASRACLGGAYSVDAGIDGEGTARLIEVNRIRLCGLYAADVGRIAAALADLREPRRVGIAGIAGRKWVEAAISSGDIDRLIARVVWSTKG